MTDMKTPRDGSCERAVQCDGYVRQDDADALELAFGSTPRNCDPNYVAVFPDCDCMMGDLDNNGVVNWDDYEYFYGHLGDIGVVYKYTWDGENRLIRAQPGRPVNGDRRADFEYFYGRLNDIGVVSALSPRPRYMAGPSSTT